MLTPGRALSLNAESGREMPRVEWLEALYANGTRLRHGQVVMVAGRSGSQKSGFVMALCDDMNLPTLYFSADMSPFTASSRLASRRTGQTTEQLERAMAEGGASRERVLECLQDSHFTFSFGSPITWKKVDEELDAYVELWDAFPEVIVYDNLMDFEGAESDYAAQVSVMASATEVARDTGATVFVLHHASDKSWEAKTDPWSPPSRDQIKNGLSEKPELSLTVALDPNSLLFNVAVVKDRSGPQDPTAKRWISLRCEPELTRFHRVGIT